MKELILGGVRSGKSSLAEGLAVESGLPVTYIATARGGDPEMQARIAHHRSRRPAHWELEEAGGDLAAVLTRLARPRHCLLVDCLTLWLTGIMAPVQAGPAGGELAEGGAEHQEPCREIEELLAVLPNLPGRIIMVGNETGLGVVPMGVLTRRFCDESGRLHQRLAAICDRVILTVAGLPLVLKHRSPEDS